MQGTVLGRLRLTRPELQVGAPVRPELRSRTGVRCMAAQLLPSVQRAAKRTPAAPTVALPPINKPNKQSPSNPRHRKYAPQTLNSNITSAVAGEEAEPKRIATDLELCQQIKKWIQGVKLFGSLSAHQVSVNLRLMCSASHLGPSASSTRSSSPVSICRSRLRR